MAKSRYRVTFADGSTVEKEAESADLAKAHAKNERIAEADPGRRMLAADLQRHNRVKVESVIELSEDERASRTRKPANGGGPRRAEPPAPAPAPDNGREDDGHTEGARGPEVIT